MDHGTEKLIPAAWNTLDGVQDIVEGKDTKIMIDAISIDM
jgi:hypothetical protein